jgi:hypothetical protein
MPSPFPPPLSRRSIILSWRIEEAFKRIKHRLSLEHTSGLSWHAANQDFGAKVIFDNLNALAAYVATDAHLDPDSPYKSTVPRRSKRSRKKSAAGCWPARQLPATQIPDEGDRHGPAETRPRSHEPP